MISKPQNELAIIQSDIPDSRKGTSFFELSTRIKENGRIPWLSVGDRILTKADGDGIFHCFIKGCNYSSNMKDSFRKHIQRGPHDRFDLPLGCSRPVQIVFTDLVIDNRYNVMVCLSCSMIVEPKQFHSHCKFHNWPVEDFDQHVLSDRELLLKKIQDFGKENGGKRMNFPIPIKGLETHMGLSCALCEEIFEDPKDVQRMHNHHQEQHVGQPMEYGYIITYQKLFPGDNQVIVRFSKFLCNQCGTVLPSELELGLHIAWYHQQDVCIKISKDSTIPGKKCGDIISQTKDSNDSFHCPVVGCMFKTRSSEAFKLHVIEFPHDLTPEQLSIILQANNPHNHLTATLMPMNNVSVKRESPSTSEDITSLKNTTQIYPPTNTSATTGFSQITNSTKNLSYMNSSDKQGYNEPKNINSERIPIGNDKTVQTSAANYLESMNSGISGYNTTMPSSNSQSPQPATLTGTYRATSLDDNNGAIPPRGAEPKESEYYCTLCQKNYDSSISLLRHMTGRHSKEVTAKLTSKSNIPGFPIGHIFNAKRVNDSLKCPITNCDFSTQRSDAWRKHISTASHEKLKTNDAIQSFQPPFFANTKLVVDTYYGLTICTECGCGVPLANLDSHCQIHGWNSPVLATELLDNNLQMISTKAQFYQTLKKLHFNKFTGKQEDAKAVSVIPVLNLILCNHCHSYFSKKKDYHTHFISTHTELPFIDKLSKPYQKVFNDDQHYLRIQE
ncbi:hypothetical protein NADFUDRAFT_67870 [Nadsonia fulvescens var. elongata DSM 6958]|uniref:C2H2-type domain-containing protein n=1 Tax=Nadsonia fulvescens var. elongata DSM 6958 TaxID=857566 RepID=A0A1E3PDI5_9ASCO|nr:hypothetical protein NADFUDRAFT_67870 [Nadsonia fulvescens var. elongata DSM 6958]